MLTTDFCERHGCQCSDGCPQGCYLTRAILPRGPWCCERGQELGMQVCPECARFSAAYLCPE